MRTPSSTLRVTRRQAVLAGGAVVAGMSLAGCGTGGSKDFTQPEGTVPSQYKGRQRIVLWSPYSGATGKAIAGLGDKFNESQNDIYLEVQYQGGHTPTTQKLLAAIKSKQVPDLVSMGYSAMLQLYLSEQVAPLESLLDGLKLSDYDPNFLKEGQIGDHTYMVPFARSTPLFYYNKDLFAKAGLPDRAPKTWDELNQWGEHFKGMSAGDTNVKMYGLSSQDGDWQLEGMLWNFGGSEAIDWTPHMTAKESIATGEYTRRLVQEKKAYMADNIVADFENGLMAAAAMSTASLTGLLNVVKFELGAGFMPGGPNGRAIKPGGQGLCVPAGVPEERQAAAGKVISFLGQPSQSAAFTEGSGYIPVNKAAMEEPEYKALLKKNKLYAVAGKQMQYAHPTSELRRWVTQIGADVFEAFQDLWTKNAKSAKRFATLNQKMQTEEQQFATQYGKKVGAPT